MQNKYMTPKNINTLLNRENKQICHEYIMYNNFLSKLELNSSTLNDRA